MNALLVAGLILGIGAPPKEVPKKGPPSIVGTWDAEKAAVAGMEIPIKATLFEFTAEGKLIITKVDLDVPTFHKHKLDASKTPAEIDLFLPGNDKKPIRAIYKIDGDTLTLCFEDSFDSQRPTKFESLKGTKTMIWTLKRVEKKKE